MAHSQALQHAPQAMVQVRSQQHYGHDIEDCCWPFLQASNHVMMDGGFYIVWMHLPAGEMQQMIHDEAGDNGTAQHHGSAGISGMSIIFLNVCRGSGATLHSGQRNRRPNVQHHSGNQNGSSTPKYGRHAVQEFTVLVYFEDAFRVWGQENLQITHQMNQHKAEQYNSGGGHYGLFSDCGVVKTQIAPNAIASTFASSID